MAARLALAIGTQEACGETGDDLFELLAGEPLEAVEWQCRSTRLVGRGVIVAPLFVRLSYDALCAAIGQIS